MSIFSEFVRRNVFKVAAAYIVVGWLILQVGEAPRQAQPMRRQGHGECDLKGEQIGAAAGQASKRGSVLAHAPAERRPAAACQGRPGGGEPAVRA